jgi:tetratricopeptide (TPR) repeat protein
MNEERLKKLLQWEAEKPDDAFLKYAIAEEYVSAGRDIEALKYFTLLLKKFPEYLPTYYQLGKLMERIGKVDEAKAVYERGKEIAQAAGDTKTLRELKEAQEQLEDE